MTKKLQAKDLEKLQLKDLFDSIMEKNNQNIIKFFTKSGKYFVYVTKNAEIFQAIFYRSINIKEGLPKNMNDYYERDYRVMTSLGENTVIQNEDALIVIDKMKWFLDKVNEESYLFGVENQVVNLYFKDLSKEE